MDLKDDIKKILEIAIHAPSGENCQPWRFVIKENRIDIFNIPEKDTSLYNVRQLGSYVAHGALIENILIASSVLGYRASLVLFPDNQDFQHTARVFLEKTDSQEKDLYRYIEKRTTNRKPYEKKPLTQEQKNELLKSTSEIGEEGELKLVEDRDNITNLAKALTVSDRMLFENRKVHDFLFSHISWDKEKAERKRSGFYIKELELAPPQEKAFKLFRNWNILNFFNKLGFAKVAAKGNVKLYASCAAIGAVVVSTNSPKDFLIGGRLMQRVWLKATKMNLSIQPITGAIFFIQRIFANEGQDFSADHIKLVENAYQVIVNNFNIKGKTVAMLFRIGEGREPSARSLRLPPSIIFD